MDAIERAILGGVARHKDQILAFAEDIFRHPELSDQETRTAAQVARMLEGIGLQVQTGLSGTGVLARTGPRRPCVVLVAELDAIPCPGHPAADPATGAAHACGHHAQLAAMVGAAFALTQPEVYAALDGDVAFFAVPAEECNGGKCRLIREGAFDAMDIAVTHHTNFSPGEADLVLGSARTNGVMMKRIVITGKAAHAGGAPHDGINALSAASLGMSAIGYLREGFRDEDGVRVHGIIREGGAAQNVIPDRVVLEYGVRANNAAALVDAGEKVNRAFQGAALALGAQATTEDLFAYAPVPFRAATAWQVEVGEMLCEKERVRTTSASEFYSISTDVGDLCRKMPVVNFTTGGFAGSLHGVDYRMEDADAALLLPARVMALSAYRLLRDGAREAASLLL